MKLIVLPFLLLLPFSLIFFNSSDKEIPVIDQQAVTRYRAAVTRAADENHLRLMVSGPWAPYAFADNW